MRTSAFLNDREEVDLMDCFLIKHCIWDEEWQEDKIWQFVREAIEENGYTKEIDFANIKDELINFKTEIEEETKFVKDTRVKMLETVYDDYFEILNPPDQNSNLIKQTDFYNLSNQNISIYLYYWYAYYQQVRNNYTYNVRKTNSKFSVFINDTEYKLKTTTQGGKKQATKKPHPSVEKDWDEKVKGFLQHTSDMRNQIEQYCNKDLEHLRTNLFVDPSLANTVESHITATRENIGKIEMEIKAIQNGYKKLKDEEIVEQ